jgi:endonuclease-3
MKIYKFKLIMTKFPKTLKAEKHRIESIISNLAKIYPDVKIQLKHQDPFQLMIATILSAQCTDARVNIVTQSLFKKYITPEDYLKVPVVILEQDIFSTGFYKAKAKNIRGACEKIISDFSCKVPNNMEDLLTLPGVGRKTANVLLGHCFNTPGIVVDTHVIRISNRLGFIETEDALKIEYYLMKIIDKDLWVSFTHLFINLGRNICVRNPKCAICPIAELCPKVLKEKK